MLSNPRRRVLFVGLVAAALAAIVWRQFSVDFYLYRVRGGRSATAVSSLRSVGPRALPRIYREIHALGDRPALGYRADLVKAVAGIRHDAISARIGSVLLWEVEATLADVEPTMVDALGTAATREPDAVVRQEIANAARELDFNTKVAFFCAAYPRMKDDDVLAMLLLIDTPVRHATGAYDPKNRPPHGDPSYPFRDLPSDAIAKLQAEMRTRLGCAVPLLVGTAVTRGPSLIDQTTSYWAIQLAITLGRLRPLPDDARQQLVALIPKLRSGTLLLELLVPLAADLAQPSPAPFREALAKTFLAAPNDNVRYAVSSWVEDHGSDATLSRDAFVCSVFADTHDDNRLLLFRLLVGPKAPPHAPCSTRAAMKAYEALAGVVLDDALPPYWTERARTLLKANRTPEVIAWARGLRPRVKNKDLAAQLDAVLEG